MPQKFPIMIVGGNSMVGGYLMQRLKERGYVAEVISRRPLDVPTGFTLSQIDLTQERNWIAPADGIVLSLLPMWVLAQMLPRFMGVRSIIATGSTSVFSKASSLDSKERALSAALETAENQIRDWAEKRKVNWTILRTTLIYDGKSDKNVTRMANFIRRWRVLPLAAPADGLRQPIHADDVAKAVVASIENLTVANKGLNIAGGEVLTYKAMAERVFAALAMSPRFVMLPTGMLMKAFHTASKIGLINESAFGASVFERMNQDLIFNAEEGARALELSPRGFQPEF